MGGSNFYLKVVRVATAYQDTNGKCADGLMHQPENEVWGVVKVL